MACPYILKIWEEEQIQTSWLDILFYPLYKKGHRLECSHYRKKKFFTSVCRIFSGNLFNRLEPLEDFFIGEHQAAALSSVCSFRSCEWFNVKKRVEANYVRTFEAWRIEIICTAGKRDFVLVRNYRWTQQRNLFYLFC